MFTGLSAGRSLAARLGDPAQGGRGPFEARKVLLDRQRQPGSKASSGPSFPSPPPQVDSHSELRKGRAWGLLPACLPGSASRSGTAWPPDFNDFLNPFCFLPQGKEER